MESQILYKWITPYYPVNAQKAGKTIEEISRNSSVLKLSYIVEDSEYKYAALHKCFEWNNHYAAEKYRLAQARDILNNLTAERIGNVSIPNPIQAFVSFKKENEYFSVINVLKSAELREYMLDAAMRELDAFYRKYASLEYLSELMGVIEKNVRRYQQYVDL